MRLLIDLQGCQNGSRHRGIGRYSLALTKALCRTAGEHTVCVLLSDLFSETIDGVRRELGGFIKDQHVLRFHASEPVDELRPENARRQHAAEWLRESMVADFAPDALLISSMVEGAMDNSVSSVGWVDSGAVVASVLYDLIPLLDPDRYIGWEPARRWYHSKLDSMRRCDLLLCISESAAREAVEALGVPQDRVLAISTAADEKFVDVTVTTADLQACRTRFGIRRRYIMHSGNVEPRKNFDGLIRAFGALPSTIRRSYQLVLVGKVSGEGQIQLEAEAAKAGLATSDLVLTGHVSDDDLMALYAGCHLFVFPSLHEGFGLPALEAMHFGVPTIGSNTTSVPEVLGRADAAFDPTSTAAITALMQRCLTDETFYAELKAHARSQARRFDWNDIARRTWRAFEKAIAARRASAVDGGHPMAAPSRLRLMMGQLIAPPQLVPPNDEELAHLAHCIALNQGEVDRARAHSDAGQITNWRVEGPFDSSYSLALVNREAARGLSALGQRVTLHSTEGPGDFPANPAFLAANPDLQEMHAREPGEIAAAIDVQARNLYPPRVADMSGRVKLLHQYAWEESGFPREWVSEFNRHLDGITCTSHHVQKVLADNGVKVPAVVVGNGVDHWERVTAAPHLHFPGKPFRFLHVSSCFPRKGADIMLSAYGGAFNASDDVTLIIKTFPNPHNDIHRQLAALRAANARYPDVHIIEEDLSDPGLKALYQHCHVLVAPSRAEGFGLPMAEAMLSGLPVITTGWSGQMDFCSAENSWLVDFRFAPAHTHIDLFGSVWADPDRSSLAEAMLKARAASDQTRHAMAERGRKTLMRHFRWIDVAARAVTAINEWKAKLSPRAARIGWITTWNTRCGIASYARHIVEAAAEPVVVLAPRQPGLVREDEDFVHRCWHSSKEQNAFDDLTGRIGELALDVLVIQFNYAFFNLRAFGEFLHNQIDAGRAVVVAMHATADPSALALWDDNWRLATATPALARCQRLLVHSVADLNRLKDAGLVDNVTLFPHPLWHLPPASIPAAAKYDEDLPVVATFGYCLPHKGLPEVLQAVHEMRRRGRPTRLLMLNAEYPDPVSSKLVRDLQEQITRLGLRDLVTFRSDYLPDAEVAALLGQVDLIVFAYQDTQESASGAVRHGLATGEPVLVTPIRIFDDLGDAVFRTQGLDPEALAEAVTTVLAALADGTEQAQAVVKAAERWRAAHDVHDLARRLFGMAHALARPPLSVDYRFEGSSRVLRTEVGVTDERGLTTTGKSGHLLFGPYLALPPGRYVAELTWTYRIPTGASCHLRVVVRNGSVALCREEVKAGMQMTPATTRMHFELDTTCGDLEVQLQVDAHVQACVHVLQIRARGAVALAAPDGATAGNVNLASLQTT